MNEDQHGPRHRSLVITQELQQAIKIILIQQEFLFYHFPSGGRRGSTQLLPSSHLGKENLDEDNERRLVAAPLDWTKHAARLDEKTLLDWTKHVANLSTEQRESVRVDISMENWSHDPDPDGDGETQNLGSKTVVRDGGARVFYNFQSVSMICRERFQPTVS